MLAFSQIPTFGGQKTKKPGTSRAGLRGMVAVTSKAELATLPASEGSKSQHTQEGGRRLWDVGQIAVRLTVQ